MSNSSNINKNHEPHPQPHPQPHPHPHPHPQRYNDGLINSLKLLTGLSYLVGNKI